MTLKEWSFPDSSVGEESACNSGDPGLISGSGRSSGEGIGYPLHYSWASLETQLVKNPPAMQETWVWSLGWEDTLEKGKATHSSTLAWRIPWMYSLWSLQRIGYNWAIFTFTFCSISSSNAYLVGCLLLSHVWLFCDLRDCSLSDSSVHGISQARILEWVAISFSRESSQPRD